MEYVIGVRFEGVAQGQKNGYQKMVRVSFNVIICISMWDVKYSLLYFICYHARKLALFISF